MPPALPLQQHPAFARALTALGLEPRTTALRTPSGVAVGSALVVTRRLAGLATIRYIPRGPIWSANASPQDRAAALAALPVRLIEAEAPCPGLRLAGFRQVATAAHVAEVDLRGDGDARRRALDGKWRGHLRQAERGDLVVDCQAFDGDPAHWLLEREAATRRARRYHALGQAVACAFARTNPGQARLHVARLRGEPVAGMLVLLHPPIATYHIGWSGDLGRASSAHHLLLMRAADDLAAAGFARLDLGTVDTDANPGLARFKIGAGGRVRALGGSWLRLPFAHALATRAARG